MLLASSLLFWSTASLSSEAPYSRAECLSGIELKWKQASDDERVRILNQLGRTYPNLKRKYGGGSVGIRGTTSIYVQFNGKCEHKDTMMINLANDWRSTVEYFPDFELIQGTVRPSRETIDARGARWRDKQE
jgi:hypothetical protein